MKKILPIIIVIVLVALAAVVALGRNKPETSTNNTSQPSNASSTNDTTTQPVNTDSVSIKDMTFSPASITVKKGTTVTWTNQDGTSHTVTADGDNGPESGTLTDGKSYSFTFNSAGTFTYHCNFHSSMQGTVTVTE
jgi:plastocyanin